MYRFVLSLRSENLEEGRTRNRGWIEQVYPSDYTKPLRVYVGSVKELPRAVAQLIDSKLIEGGKSDGLD